ncbi:MAG: glycosyltransferase [Bacteroidota bacterium]|nr:glycosyltransferase [Bacteroidota bacterium]MDP3144353.1 glycosyltransferase [Bacteroidota bacterium]
MESKSKERNSLAGISVIICCYNSADRIIKTLNHLSNQDIPEGMSWEVLIIDNNSSDNTAKIAKSEWDKYGNVPEIRIINESKQGLNYARETGVENSKFSFVLFCDDDNWLNQDYIKHSFEILNSDKEIGAVGGYSIPASNDDLPLWFSTYQDWYAVGAQNLTEGDITFKKYLWGAGLCLKKEIFEIAKTNKFQIFLSDRKGSSLSSGGDSELSYWVLLCGYTLWYSEKLQFKHFVPKERLSKDYVIRLKKANQECAYWLGKYDLLYEIKQLNRSKSENLIKGVKLLIKHKLSFLKNRNNLTTAQFLIGTTLRVSSKDDFDFITVYEKALNRNN